MRIGLRWKRCVRGALLLGVFVALIAVVNRGQALPGANDEGGLSASWNSPAPLQGEPPMVDAVDGKAGEKAAGKTGEKTGGTGVPPVGTPPPFAPPPPTPLPPEQANLGVPLVPFVPAEPMDPPVPLVRLRVRAPSQIAAEKEIEYRLTVENVSSADAHHVLVRDRLPRGSDHYVRAEPKPTKDSKATDGSTDLLWELGTLKAGQRKTILLVIHPKETEDVVNRAYVQFEHGQKVTTRIAHAGLSLRIEAPPRTISPNPIVFRMFVTNSGPLPADDVVLKDVLPKGLVYGHSKPQLAGEDPLLWKLGRVRPGETRYIELEAIPTKSGDHVNKIEVSSAGGGKQTKEVRVTVGEEREAATSAARMTRPGR
jgi:uncharacterized repeat protein (TIGR01451 family)